MSDTTSEADDADNGALFSARDIYTGDPLNPDLETPTPASIVATLNRTERENRVRKLVEQSQSILDNAIEKHRGNRQIVAKCILYSGGNDSTVLAHMFREQATHAVHANTTIGIEQTRQFVRDTCAAWGLPLMERVAPTSYRELVLERGFPGPAMHYKMYQRLKERCLDQIRRELVENGFKQRIVFIAGRRRQESDRRKDIPLDERKASVIWASPLAMWTKLDMSTYRLMNRETDPVPVNEVSDLIHMSGECLCGAFAHRDELEELRDWFPDVAAEIDQLAKDVTAAGIPAPFNTWGHGEGAPSIVGAMCSSCEVRGQLSLLDDKEAS